MNNFTPTQTRTQAFRPPAYLKSPARTLQRQVQARPASASPDLVDAVYRQLIWHSSVAGVTDKATERNVSTAMPLTRAAFKAQGLSDRGIDAKVRTIIADACERSQRFELARAVPKLLWTRLTDGGGAADVVFDNWIIPVPGLFLNRLICGQLQREFTVPELLSVPGFLLETVEPDEDFYDDPIDGGFVELEYRTIRLDIEPWLSRQGFIMPIFDGYGTGAPNTRERVKALKVFRRPNDERPFVLRSREVSLNA